MASDLLSARRLSFTGAFDSGMMAMKMFCFDLKLASQNGAMRQRVIAAIDVPDMKGLADMLNSTDFILVEKFHEGDSGLYQVGPEIINQRVIGKVREYKTRSEQRAQAA